MSLYNEILTRAKDDLTNIMTEEVKSWNLSQEDAKEKISYHDWYDDIAELAGELTPIYLSDLVEVLRDDTFAIESGFREAKGFGADNLIQFIQMCFQCSLSNDLHEDLTEQQEKAIENVFEKETV